MPAVDTPEAVVVEASGDGTPAEIPLVAVEPVVQRAVPRQSEDAA
jgi:hypothetical protein